jgi:hypothetical protein
VYALKWSQIRDVIIRCAKVSQPEIFIIFENLAAFFCTRFKALT